jgi:hypothetical protein
MAWRIFSRPSQPDGSPSPSRVPQLVLELLVALSLAFLVWLYFRTRSRESLDHVQVPVQLTLAPEFADQYDLEVTGSPHVIVSFVGPPSRIRELHELLQRGEVRVNFPVTVPPDRAQESRYRDTVRVQAADVPVPPGVTPLVAEGANRIAITLHRLGERTLPVQLRAPEDQTGQVSLEPETVLVRGPEDILERARAIPTVPLKLTAALGKPGEPEKPLSLVLPLVREMEGRPVRALPATVQVQVTVKPPPRLFQVKQVPVKFLCPAAFPYRPQFVPSQAGKITLRIKAPTAPPSDTVVAFIDLTRSRCKQGVNEGPVQLQLPRDCQLAQDLPGPLKFELVPTENASTWLGVETEP